MYTRLINLIPFVLALSLVGNVQAKDTYFRNADPGDSLWSTPGNWDNGLPTVGDWAKIRGGDPGATIANDVGEVLKIAIGYDEGSVLTVVDGGSLATDQDVVVGRNSDGTLNMMGGTIDCRRDLELGYNNPAVLNMTGGTIIVGRDVELPKSGNGQTTHVDLHGGTLIVNDDLLMGDGGTMDITGGTLIIDANVVSIVQGYIDNGWITAYGGVGTLNVVYADSVTTITAVHPLKPFPTDNSLVSPGDLELSWTLPDPCVPGQPVPVDVYITDDLQALQTFTNPAAMQVVNKQSITSVVVQTQLKTRYYWAVDAYIGSDQDPVFGPIFSFVVADNFPPTVDTGDDVSTWVTDGSIDVALDATVTDDGYLQPYTVQWTMVSEPNDPNSPDAVITDPTAEDTSITLAAVGEYFLQLEAFDGEYTGSDTVTINVYNDSCEAAQSLPDYVPLVGDLNGDCRVDIDDMLLLLENWLKDISLTEQ